MHCGQRRDEIRQVGTDRVVPRPTVQDVLPGTAVQVVVTGAARQAIVRVALTSWTAGNVCSTSETGHRARAVAGLWTNRCAAALESERERQWTEVRKCGRDHSLGRSVSSTLVSLGVRLVAKSDSMNLSAIRYQLSSMAENARNFLRLVSQPGVKRIVLAASPGAHTPADRSWVQPLVGPDTNLPLLWACIFREPTDPTQGSAEIFDGLFLTAARHQRAEEVRQVLDALTDDPRACVAEQVMPFTQPWIPQWRWECLGRRGR